MIAFVGAKPPPGPRTWHYHVLGDAVAYYPAGSQLQAHGKQLDLIYILQLGFTYILLWFLHASKALFHIFTKSTNREFKHPIFLTCYSTC